MKISPKLSILIMLLIIACVAEAQPITGVWRGKVIRGNGLGKQTYKLEVKLIKNGDSLTGTSYYYASANNYFRYSVKGIFGTTDNSISWWDDQLIESRLPNIKLGSTNSQPLFSTADFNCPGGKVMLLNGNTHPKNGGNNYEIHLEKYDRPDFPDEWDPVIEDYFYGGADPHIIDSVGQIAFIKPKLTIPETPINPVISPKETTVYLPPPVIKKEPAIVFKPVENKPVEKPVVLPKKPVEPVAPVEKTITAVPVPIVMKAPPTIEEKFVQRRVVPTTNIPVIGDSIEFKFYDNAEVDGDSISIFLNKKMIYTHIRLTDRGYSIKIATASLEADNELVMVAENLGSIPPNTAYMEAWSGGQRYTARLESTENSSAMIKLKKE